jgi:hypothetical protein
MAEEKITVPGDLAARLTGWHSSMYDPVYAVSSNGLAKHSVPRKVFEDALHNMEACKDNPNHKDHQQEVAEICAAMQSILGQDVEFRKAIVNAMARYLWSSAWADRAESEGWDVSLGGEITHLAPETHPEAVKYAEDKLAEFEELNKKTIGDIFAAYENPPDAYEFGGQLASALLGYGIYDIGDYETPYCESCELWDLIPEPDEAT